MQGHSHRQSWFFGTRVFWIVSDGNYQFYWQTLLSVIASYRIASVQNTIPSPRTIANFVVHFTCCTVKVVPKGALENPCSTPVSVHFWLDNTQIKILGQSFRLSESGFSMMDLAHCHNSHHFHVVILVRTRPFGTTIPWMHVPGISMNNASESLFHKQF